MSAKCCNTMTRVSLYAALYTYRDLSVLQRILINFTSVMRCVHLMCTYTHLPPRLFLNRLNFEMSADQREDHALQILRQEQNLVHAFARAKQHQTNAVYGVQTSRNIPVLDSKTLWDHLGPCSAVLASKSLVWWCRTICARSQEPPQAPVYPLYLVQAIHYHFPW